MDYDVIVIGAGSMGSAALYHLAKRGVRALGLERWHIGHDHGSAHGQTRIIRQAYFEHSDYVPLLRESYALWRELEDDSGTTLMNLPGMLYVGQDESTLISGVRQSAIEHDLEIHDLSQCPDGFVAPPGSAMLLEPNAGYLRVEACVQAHAQLAQKHGAKLLTNTSVDAWTANESAVHVHTSEATHTAGHLIICGGAWNPQLLGPLGLPLTVRRKVLCWFHGTTTYDASQRCPVFAYGIQGRIFYGFPAVDQLGIKVAEHTGGQDHAHPDSVERTIQRDDVQDVEAFVKANMPDVTAKVMHTSTCMYTMTPDEHFVVDHHPQFDNITYATGFSGHGFKFASAIGKALSDMATTGNTDLPIGFLSAGRLGTV